MMCPMMRTGMMGSAMMGSGMMHGGMSALFGSYVTPVMNLSVDDVRGYLASQLERLNKRLKAGDINSVDATITADIVTVDNSLVQRLKVDRHTGASTRTDPRAYMCDPRSANSGTMVLCTLAGAVLGPRLLRW